MKRVLILLLALAGVHALERGKDYEKEKVCKEFAYLGKDGFTSLSIILYSRKFPSGTFEQIKHLINEVVSLTEACCAESADPDCYDQRTSALSEKSCESDSPFPAHPGTSECCASQGLERKLCMATLKHPPQEFPTYVEPTNDEICEEFRKDPKGFAEQFMYEYSINYGQAPLSLLVSYEKNYLSMVGSCCTSSNPNICFLKERMQNKHLSLLTIMSNRLCSQHVAYGREKSRFRSTFPKVVTLYGPWIGDDVMKEIGASSLRYNCHLIKLTQKIPSAELKDVLPIAEDVTAILSKCCESTSEDCLAKELPEHTVKICNYLSNKNSKFQDCCQEKTPTDVFVCVYFMPAAQPLELPDVQLPTEKDICGKEYTKAMDQYTFELSRKTHIPEVFLSKILPPTLKNLAECCNSENSAACFNTKSPQLKRELSSFIDKGQELCADYSENTFTEYKKKLAERLRAKLPDVTDLELEELVDKHSDFASKCCSMNSPPLYCDSEIDAEMKIFQSS